MLIYKIAAVAADVRPVSWIGSLSSIGTNTTVSAFNGTSYIATNNTSSLSYYAIDQFGNVQFQNATTGGATGDSATCLVQKGSYGYVATQLGSGSDSRFGLLKLSSNAIAWQKKLDSVSYVNSVAVDGSENSYAIGYYASKPTLVKFDSNGNIVWQRSLASGGSGYSVAVDGTNSNIYINSGTAAGTYYKTSIAKYNSSGSLLWQKELSLSGYGLVPISDGMRVDSAGNVTVAAAQTGDATGFILIKVSSTGSVMWSKKMVGAGAAIAHDELDNIYAVYNTSGTAYIVKYNSSGTVVWGRSFTGTINSITADLNYFYTAGLYVAKLPVDGSNTGSYTINSSTVSYLSQTITPTSIDVAINNTAYAASTPAATTVSPGLGLTSTSNTWSKQVI